MSEEINLTRSGNSVYRFALAVSTFGGMLRNLSIPPFHLLSLQSSGFAPLVIPDRISAPLVHSR